MKAKFSTLLILLILVSCMNETKKNDFQELNINGQVSELTETYYKAVDKFGTITKGKKGFTIHIKFNKDGNKISESTYDSDGTLNLKTIYKYDQKGKKSEATKYDSQGNITKTVKYTYNNNLLSEGKSFNTDGSIHIKGTYSYDDKGNMTEWNRYDSNDTLINKDILHYDLEGRVKEADHYLSSFHMWKYVMSYDKNDNMVLQQVLDSNNEVEDEYSTEYEYDKNYNWIKAIKFKNAIPTNIIEREITYTN